MPLSPVKVFDPPKSLWTSERFLDWLEPGRGADLIGGEVHMHSPVSLKHARLVNFVDHLLRSFIAERNCGELHREVVAVRLGARDTFLPDLAFWGREQLADFLPTHVPVAPRLVVEALSPHTAERDLGPKFTAYEEHGVEEYWILDPERLQHQFHRLEGDCFAEYASGEETISSRVIEGFWLRREWLNPGALPPVKACLEAILRP